MENIEMEGDLLGKDMEATKLYFVTNRHNLLSMLSSGMITAAENEFRHHEDSRDLVSGLIPLWNSSIPAKCFEQAGQDNGDGRVVIEFDGVVADYMGDTGKYIKNSKVFVTAGPLPLYFANKYLFSSNTEKEDFLLRLFDDVPVDEGRLGVIKGIPIDDSPESIPGPDELDIEQVVNAALVDKGLGGLLVSLRLSKPTLAVVKILQLLYDLAVNVVQGNITTEKVQAVVSILNQDVRDTTKMEADAWMLVTMLSMLGETTPDQGVDQMDIVDKIQSASDSLDDGVKTIINKWCSYAAKVLEGEIDLHQLSDKGSVIQRAVLLYILRPSPERLEKSIDSQLRPGARVLAVGAFLTGYFSGVVRLGSIYKPDYSFCTGAVKVLLDSVHSSGPAGEGKGMDVVFNKSGNLVMDAVLSVDGFKYKSCRIEPNPVLARVLYTAKSVDYDLDYDFENDELSNTFKFEKGRKQKVYIFSIKPNIHGDDVIRFLSPCMNLKGSHGKKLTKAVAIDLLERNSELDMFCRFAKNDERNAIVVQVDQVVKNMDDGEFRAHIEQVAREADNYEKEVLGKDRY